MARKFYNDTILVLHATQYDMTDQTPPGPKATKITYVEADYMESDQSRGCEPRVATAPHELFHDLPVLPAIVNVQMQSGDTAKDRNGRVFTKWYPSTADTVEELNLTELLDVEVATS